MAEPIDYLKTYLNMNPEDYSRMQAQIGGETLPDREIFTMPARAMPMPAPRQAMEPMPMPAPQNTQVQGLMDEIASLKAQIQAMQDTPESMPVVDEAPVMPSAPSISDLQNRMAVEPMPMPTSNVPQAPAGITNRMVGEPQKLPQSEPVASVPAEQIQKSLDMLAKMPKMNIPVIPDMEEIRQKMADANIPFSTPISFEEQLQTIRDLPPMPPVTQMPQPIKQPRRSGIFGNLLDRVQKPNQMPQPKRSGFFGNLLDRVQKQIEVPQTPANIPTVYGSNVTQNPFQKINEPIPQSTLDKFREVASNSNPFALQTKPAPFMPTRARNMLDIQQRFAPQRFAGGGLSKALSELKTRIS